MKHTTILIPNGHTNLSTMACIIGAYEILARANDYWQENGKQALYEVEMAGVSLNTKFMQGLLDLKTQKHISAVKKTDLIIIPSLVFDYDENNKENLELVDWVMRNYRNGCEIASMCSGAFMLASTGLLDGKKCSTHWCFADVFKKKFPKVDLQVEKLITDEHRIYTNGGGYSFLNLMIYLVEKYYDRQTAIYCSKIFQIEMDRQSQSAFIIFTGQKQHGDEMIKKAQEYIESKIHEKISVETLSSKFAVGRRSFDRRFIKATGNTPVEYTQRAKIESAKKAFETTRKTIHEVMYEVGYSDTKAFREIFRKITGMSPLEYRGRYNKETAN
ncbi:GlxA family transcriptional regulator [Pedobacter sp.]|jgi:transcriptional regulator GlxA family with amidase domain|uniref:GlxA family transcriptional regulator n=1 Tax=Pedobacter sp. TaxID=1411316 RepID=UPI002CF47C16|nr:helix-turn-helix domain-containing protein [Pedobacter sp.]HWW41910.1 helix-turn-helix domain-containing protein [Pedobacter sp.]